MELLRWDEAHLEVGADGAAGLEAPHPDGGPIAQFAPRRDGLADADLAGAVGVVDQQSPPAVSCLINEREAAGLGQRAVESPPLWRTGGRSLFEGRIADEVRSGLGGHGVRQSRYEC